MAMVEYTCGKCGHVFKRIALLGERPESEPCPACGWPEVKPDPPSPGLFNGIAHFSDLSKDTN